VSPAPGATAALDPDPTTRQDRQLAAEGWSRRFVGGPPRLQEQVELYRSLGMEVRTEPVPPEDLGAGCQGCALALQLFRIVYTRRGS
jgi:hypothetical protein